MIKLMSALTNFLNAKAEESRFATELAKKAISSLEQQDRKVEDLGALFLATRKGGGNA